MTDHVSPEKRSSIMSAVHGRDTTPEIRLRRALHKCGLRFRLHDKRLPGRPDITFPRYGAVVFVHGCFWHRHEGCRFASDPTSHAEFWQSKFRANLERDKRNFAQLRKMGWRVAIVWTCALRRKSSDRVVAMALQSWLQSDSQEFAVPNFVQPS